MLAKTHVIINRFKSIDKAVQQAEKQPSALLHVFIIAGSNGFLPS